MSSSRRITQTPSIEKDKERERERRRMIQGVEGKSYFLQILKYCQRSIKYFFTVFQ